MAKKGYLLSEEDVRLLQSMLRAERNRRVNAPSRSQVDRTIPTAPDVYIALPPEGGIPGLTLSDTVPASGDIPGSAPCDLYKIADGILDTVPSGQKLVYNPFQTIVEGWIPVHRTKSGPWICGSPGIDEIYFGLAQSDWVEGSPHDYVSVRRCDGSGADPTGIAFDVNLLSSNAGDPNVRQDDVIAYGQVHALDGTSYPVCVSDYLDDKIGTIKMWSGSVADIPPGWQLFTAMQDKFVRGGDGYNTGTTGGYDKHGGTENDHDDHTIVYPAPIIQILDHADHTIFVPPLSLTIVDHPAHGPLEHDFTGPGGGGEHTIQISAHDPKEFSPHGPLFHDKLDDHDVNFPGGGINHFPDPMVHEVIEDDTVDNVGGISSGVAWTGTTDGHSHSINVGGGELIHTIQDHPAPNPHFLNLEGFDFSHNPNPIGEHGTPELTHPELQDHDDTTLNLRDHDHPGSSAHQKYQLQHSKHVGMVDPIYPITLEHTDHVLYVLPMPVGTVEHTETDNKPVFYTLAFIERIH